MQDDVALCNSLHLHNLLITLVADADPIKAPIPSYVA